jgi:hypothetical protein
MPITDVYSKRQKILNGEISDTLTYDKIPKSLRWQIIYIINDMGQHNVDKVCEYVKKTLCREYGIPELCTIRYSPHDYEHKRLDYDEVKSHILNQSNVEHVIDAVELFFKYIKYMLRDNKEMLKKIDNAIDELNDRFKEHGIGYSFENNQIIKIDSTYIHCEVTKTTLNLLNNKNFLGANEEYLSAHEHYKSGRNKECIVECLKAFESTMKIILKEKGWEYNEKDTSHKLIQICFNNELIPKYIQTQFLSLKSLLESGIPTVRNNSGAHGQGDKPQIITDEIVRYALNLTGANIIFLVELSKIK